MPADGGLYVFGGGAADGEWVSPRPVGEAVADAVTATSDLTTDEIDDLEAYVDPADLAAHLDGEADEAFTFTVEGHTVAGTPAGTVEVDPV